MSESLTGHCLTIKMRIFYSVYAQEKFESQTVYSGNLKLDFFTNCLISDCLLAKFESLTVYKQHLNTYLFTSGVWISDCLLTKFKVKISDCLQQNVLNKNLKKFTEYFTQAFEIRSICNVLSFLIRTMGDPLFFFTITNLLWSEVYTDHISKLINKHSMA